MLLLLGLGLLLLELLKPGIRESGEQRCRQLTTVCLLQPSSYRLLCNQFHASHQAVCSSAQFCKTDTDACGQIHLYLGASKMIVALMLIGLQQSDAVSSKVAAATHCQLPHSGHWGRSLRECQGSPRTPEQESLQASETAPGHCCLRAPSAPPARHYSL